VNTSAWISDRVVAAGELATVTTSSGDVPTLPSTSVAVAVSVTLPSATVVVSHCTL
jgi:hypothetical protein